MYGSKVEKRMLKMNNKIFTVREKKAVLYPTYTENSPLIVLNNYSGDGKSVTDALGHMGCPSCNLLCVGNLTWDHDMTPWYCPPLSPSDPPYTGGADEYLELLLSEILPKAEERINGTPCFLGIAGYSLAGLFALYAMYQCDVFDRVASMSGSLWFPHFREYCLEHEMKRKPDKIYLSLGDQEAKTRNRFLKTVQENTESIAKHYRELGMNVVWEWNPGNHFKDVALRSAKGIAAIL